MSKKQVPPQLKKHSKEVTEFLLDIESVCKKHGMSISHEDAGHGSFLVKNYRRLHRDLLWMAWNELTAPLQRANAREKAFPSDQHPDKVIWQQLGKDHQPVETGGYWLGFHKDNILRITPTTYGRFDGFLNGAMVITDTLRKTKKALHAASLKHPE